MLDFIYLPLIEQHRLLSSLHTHTLKEYTLSQDSIHQAHSSRQETLQSQRVRLQNTQDNLSAFAQYADAQEPILNPFALMPNLIEFAKTHHLTLSSFAPYPLLNALNIEGIGHFDDILALLSFIESHSFFSIDTLAFTPQNAQIHFHIAIVDYRLDTGALELQ